MSLETTLQAAADAGQLLKSSHENIQALLAASTNPVYRASIEELAAAGAWEELNDRFFQALKFGTGGLRGRTLGKIVTLAERGSAPADQQPNHPCVGTNAMNYYNVGRPRGVWWPTARPGGPRQAWMADRPSSSATTPACSLPSSPNAAPRSPSKTVRTSISSTAAEPLRR